MYLFRGQEIPVRHLLTAKYCSPGAWVSARVWLEQCVQGHRCGEQSSSYSLPTRLLDLSENSKAEAHIRLIDQPPHDSGRYVCLSHCWGPLGCALTTTTGNLPTHEKCGEFLSLPLSFRQAILFTRWLGVRYLWIDSLCIIQDDEEDW
ncbi:hypothetical protein BCR34DRAFT_478490 [Clohesyomyces aquaticus]|uniref:Heterokaryon incompatibility domain-containing protein n=1 Tax=Clohesyomyces aquaticus TaxID=1231657 RepID=A0A1Y1ZXP3_9PLEO|nr:hypothetical protein BCR34DRAFT_478490 [Clohesyomyces aquaticus]